MSASWYLVRYMPDLYRREPRNIGLLLSTTQGWYGRFFGEGEDGRIDGRSVRSYGVNPDIYRSWVKYYRRKMEADAWSDIERLQATKPSNFLVEKCGEYVASTQSWLKVLDELYADLVEDQSEIDSLQAEQRPADRLLTAVDAVLDGAGVLPQRSVKVPAKFGTELDVVPFLYSYVNGQKHLMDIVSKRSGVDQAAHDARELSARVEGAMKASSAQSFIAFYDNSMFPADQIEHILRPVEYLSQTINVAEHDSAVETLRVMTSHDLTD